MEGYDANWSEPVNERHATYTNLSPGHYTFHVKAIDEAGLVSLKEATLEIYIVPALWQRWWFRLLIFIVLIAFLTWLSSWLLSKRRRQKQKQLQDELIISELQFKTFRNQMEPHFTFNAINTIGASIYSKEPEIAYTHLQKFSRLVRSLILSADQVSRPLAEELDFVRNYLELEYYRFSDRFSFDINIEEDVNTTWEVPKMIVQTYVENALKHGLLPKAGAGILKISAFLEHQNLIIEIMDNGIGRIAAANNNSESTGKGLKIIREYCNFYEKRFGRVISSTIEDLANPEGKAIGTKVRIQIQHENTSNKTTKHE
jgi:LytS/YehU family sensor histidine kinase